MRIKARLIVVIAIAVWCGPAYAQTANSNTDAMTNTVKEFDRLLTNSERISRSTVPTSRTPRSIAPVLQAIPEFRKATADLRQGVGDPKRMRAPLQSIEKLIKPFAEYFKDLKLKSEEPDVQDLKTYSQKDLFWETLTTAERVDNNLQVANRLLRESSRTDSVSIKTLQFYGEIDADLKRLKWLAGKVVTMR